MLKVSEDVKRKIIELRKRKVSVSEIVKRLNLSKPTIIKYCREAGITEKKTILVGLKNFLLQLPIAFVPPSCGKRQNLSTREGS
jgi:intein-encoded DNA endonuclease-like protein